MPSPVAHTLAGLAIAHVARTRGWIPAHWGLTAAFVGAANAADLDFLTASIGGGLFYHHGITHSLIAAIAAGLVAAIIAWRAAALSSIRVGLLAGLAYASHVLMDFVAVAPWEPTDMPILWPVAPYIGLATPIQVFASIQHGGTISSLPADVIRGATLWAIAREVVVMGSVRLIAAWLAGRGPSAARSKIDAS